VAAPAAPVVEKLMRAKWMILSWAQVPNVTGYRIMRDVDGQSGFTQWGTELAPSQTIRHIDLPVHLLDWVNSRYRVDACNAAGCTASEVFFLTPQDQRDATGFFKAINTGDNDVFGLSIALSGDGRRMAIGAPREDSGSTGNPDDNSATDSGAVYTFARNAQNLWDFEGYLKSTTLDASDWYGTSVALSYDGATLAVGALNDDSGATGIDGNALDASATDSGAVYVYHRENGGWARQAYVKASNTGADDDYGYSVSLSGDGNLLAVGAPHEDSASTGVDGAQNDELANNAGAVYLYTRAGSTWSQSHYVKASGSGGDRAFGHAVSVSRDGAAMAVGANGEDSAATGIDGNQADTSEPNAGAVYVFRAGNGTWTQEAYVKASRATTGVQFGLALALDADGTTLAVGGPAEGSGATGIDGNQDDASAAIAGAVYVFERSNGQWAQQAYIKASNTQSADLFGVALALSDDGNVLAVGAPGEDSNAVGIDGNQGDDSVGGAGAVYVFQRNATSWTQRSYVKGYGIGSNDNFGSAIALRADGETLAVGSRDDSNAQGDGSGGWIQDRPDNDLSINSGAVFLF
jgi:trimeric autotransporter adhesin